MIKRGYILAIFLLSAVWAQAQTGDGKLAVSGLTAEEADGTVRVSFTAAIGPEAAGHREVYVFMPVLTDGHFRVSLPAVLVEGKDNRREVSEELLQADMIPAANGQILDYSASVEAQEWMHGGQLYIESATDVCGTVLAHPARVLSDELRLYEVPAPREVVTEVKRFAPKTMADSLSMIFPFVLPEWMFDPEDPFRIYDEERENSIIVYFRLSKYDIDESYLDNKQTLFNLGAAAEMILNDPASRVERVMVAGFASPEGSFELNDILAFNRAVAVKHHLLQHTALTDEQIWLHNGSVDWRGLRLLVEQSDMPQKNAILSIIDHTPAQSGRLDKLKRLEGGAPYRSMLENLFPLLRNGAFIKMYYSNEKQP